MGPRKTLWVLLVGSMCAAACTTIETRGPGPDHGRYYIGIVRVQHTGDGSPATPQILKMSGLGLKFEDGVTAGYFSQVRVSIPRRCRLAVINKDDQMQDYLRELQAKLGETEICHADIAD